MRIDTFACDFAPRMPRSAPATAASIAGSARSGPSPAPVSATVGQLARWIEPSCHHDQTSSVT